MAKTQITNNGGNRQILDVATRLKEAIGHVEYLRETLVKFLKKNEEVIKWESCRLELINDLTLFENDPDNELEYYEDTLNKLKDSVESVIFWVKKARK